MKKLLTLILAIVVLSGCSVFKKEEAKTPPLPKTVIRYYQAVDKKSPFFNKATVPAGSLILSCGDYLTLRSFGTITYRNSTELLEFVLASMFNNPAEPATMYTNPVQEMGIRLDRVEEVEGKQNIYLQGEFVERGQCADAQAKLMIESTIKEYARDYQIYLNDSADEWRCLYQNDCK